MLGEKRLLSLRIASCLLNFSKTAAVLCREEIVVTASKKKQNIG